MRRIVTWISMLSAVALVTAVGTGCSARMKASYHLQRAERYFNAGEYQQAEIEYKNVLRNAPNNPEAWSRLGIIYFKQGRALEAAPILAKAAQLNTNNLEVRLDLGAISLGLRQLKEARTEAGYVLDRKPDDEQAPILLADASITTNDIITTRKRLQQLYRKGETAPLDVALGILAFHERDIKSAETFFKLAIARNPKFSEAYMAMGKLYVLNKDLKQADQAFKTAADLAPISSGKGVRYAQFKILTGDASAGKQLLEDIVKKQRSYLPAWIALAQLAAAEKRYDDGLKLLDNVLKPDPQNFEGLLLKGRLELLKGETAEAIADLERLVKLFPRTPAVYYQLALAYVANQETTKAVNSLNQALSLNPKLAQATLLLAQLQMRNGNVDSAIVALKQLLQQQPGLVQARLLLAIAYRAQGSVGDAVQIYQDLEKAYPRNSEFPLLLGSAFLQQKQNAKARAEFDKALKIAPDYLPALEQLVNLDLLEKQYSAAHMRIQQQLNQNTNLPALHLLLGKVLAAQGETNQAEAALSKAIQLDPNYQAAYLLLAQLYCVTYQDQKALADLQAALDKKPKNVPALMLMSILYESEQHYQKARDTYEKLLAIDPNNAVALNNLACVYADHLGQLDKGLQLARQARKAAPTDPAIADTLGWILCRQGQDAPALSLLQESADKLFAVPEVQFHLGMAYYKIGSEAEARAEFQRALKTNKDFSGKNDCRRRLDILLLDPAAPGTKATGWLADWTAKHPDDGIALARLAAIYQHEKLEDKAISTYEAAVKANPQNVAVLKNLASLYAPKDLSKALDWAKAAYKLTPNDPGVAHLLGRLNYQSGDYKWALTLLQLTAQAEPKNPSVMYDLGEAYYSVGRVGEARTAMQKALDCATPFADGDEAKQFLALTALADHPSEALAAQAQVRGILEKSADYVPALMVAAAIDEQKAELPAAEQTYASVLKRYPDFAPAQKRLAILYAKNPTNDSAAYALATKARAAYPNDPELARTLGILLFRQGNYARAAGLLQESARNETRDRELLYYLGMAQYHLKHGAESRIALQRALDLNLSGEEAANARRILAELK